MTYLFTKNIIHFYNATPLEIQKKRFDQPHYFHWNISVEKPVKMKAVKGIIIIMFQYLLVLILTKRLNMKLF